MHLRTVGIAVIGFACVSPETQQQTTDSSAPAVVSLDQFRQLDWIVGSWQGSGGAYPAFFEEYRIVDDSTIQMRALSDSTFSVATDSSWIEFRNGQIGKRRADREYVVIAGRTGGRMWTGQCNRAWFPIEDYERAAAGPD